MVREKEGDFPQRLVLSPFPVPPSVSVPTGWRVGFRDVCCYSARYTHRPTKGAVTPHRDLRRDTHELSGTDFHIFLTKLEVMEKSPFLAAAVALDFTGRLGLE